MPSKGRIASERMMIPIPPNHCVILRQRKNAVRKGLNITGITEAPVVVNPEMVSKKASVNEAADPVTRYGRVPKIEKRIQPAVAII